MTEAPSRPRSFWIGWISAGVLLLVAAIAGVYAANLKLQLNDVELRLVDSVMKLTTSQSQLQIADAENAAIRTNLGVLVAPDVVEMKLVGKGPASEASGRVFASRAQGLLLAATKLPLLPEGRVYQLWFLSRAAPVSVGVLRTDAQGNVTAAFDVPSDAPLFTGFALSVEPEDGSTAPSSEYYLSTS